MPGVSFDRAASFYDATRAFPESVAEQLRDALVQRLGLSKSSRLLEIGIGTGRIALPYIRAGYQYCGVDISAEMLARLQEQLKPQSLRADLVQGDVMKLPLVSQSFDALLTMHVLHLVDDWQATLREAMRVLRPGGWLVLLNDERDQGQTPSAGEQVQAAWSQILDELQVPENLRRARAVRGLDQQFIDFLQAHGYTVERVNLLKFQHQPSSIRDVVQQYQGRIFSSLWFIPDHAFTQACERLEAWMERECPEPDRPFERPSRIDALICNFKC